MLTRVPQLTVTELADIELLLNECKQHDGNSIPIYKHLIDKRHPLACNVLYYKDKHLVGYLRTFFFYVDACEVALMVAPAYRRQGIASQMLREIVPVVQAENITSLIFSTPPHLHDDWLTKLKFHYRGSEYQMQYDPEKEITVHPKPATIRFATEADIPKLCVIDDACFPNKKADPDSLFQNLLRTSNCDLFVLTQAGEVVGKAHLFTESDRVRLTDIGVLPNVRGQGFGSSLIRHCVNHALVRNKTKIVLDVETNNEGALKLYNGLGFNVTNAHDYWVSPENATNFGLDVYLKHL